MFGKVFVHQEIFWVLCLVVPGPGFGLSCHEGPIRESFQLTEYAENYAQPLLYTGFKPDTPRF